jgi:DNA-binding transcriptional MerR regulator
MEREEARPRTGVKSATAFRTISEVSEELEVPQHVLRFWETKFPQVRPLKRGGGRRYYRPEDVALLRNIRRLLYSEGYTIKGVQRLLKESRQAGSEGDAVALVESLLDSDEEGPESPSVVEGPAADAGEEPAASVVSSASVVSLPLPALLAEEAAVAAPSSSPSPPSPLPLLLPAPSSLVTDAAAPASAGPAAVNGLPVWHRRQLVALRAELMELQALLRKTVR